MVGYGGTGAPPIAMLNGTRQRIIIGLLAAVLALVHIDLTPIAAPSASRGDYSTVVGVGGTGIILACHGFGPATVAIISPAAMEPAIDHAVRAQLGRSVRLCTITPGDATAHPAPDLSRLLPAALYAERALAPYVIVSAASELPRFSQAVTPVPFMDLVAGWVFINPELPPTGVSIRADGSAWSLTIGDRDTTALAILALFWPPDEA